MILEEKIKKLLPDVVIEKYLSGDELIASGCEPVSLFFPAFLFRLLFFLILSAALLLSFHPEF